MLYDDTGRLPGFQALLLHCLSPNNQTGFGPYPARFLQPGFELPAEYHLSNWLMMIELRNSCVDEPLHAPVTPTRSISSSRIYSLDPGTARVSLRYVSRYGGTAGCEAMILGKHYHHLAYLRDGTSDHRGGHRSWQFLAIS